MKLQRNTSRLVQLGMLAALSLILVYFIHIPIFPTASFLEYDMADIPILIGTFLFGPWWGLLLTAVVSILQWLLVSPQSGWIGAAMHFFATGTYVIVAGSLYRRNHTQKGAITAVALGALSMIVMMVPLNLVFTSMFQGVPMQVVIGMLVPVIIPFNAIKAGLNGIVTLLLYKPIVSVLRKTGSSDAQGGSKASYKLSVTIVLLALLAALIAIIFFIRSSAG